MKKITGNNDESEFVAINLPKDNDVVKSYKQIIPVTVQHFYITSEIGEPEKYLDMINAIKTAEEHDTIFLCLNTPGGNINSTIQIINAIEQSAATIITSLEGEVCSAGTVIFLAGHKHVINPNCIFMIHNYSHWMGGSGHEVALRVKFFEQYFRKFAYDVYGNFLTDKEIESVLLGQNIWMDSDEVSSRIENFQSKREEKNKQQN